MKGWGGFGAAHGAELPVMEISSLWVLVSADGWTGGLLWVGTKGSGAGEDETESELSVGRGTSAESVSQVSTGR